MKPKETYDFAGKYGSSDKTRQIACEHPE